MKVYKTLLIILLLLGGFMTKAQEQERPKILIGIVVDQMRYDYLQRFEKHYSEDGFKRLMQDGIHFEQTYYNYKPTMTAAGHASIFTGTTPSIHGIVANYWYSRAEEKGIYCVNLPSAGGDLYAPSRMKVNTLADEIKLNLGEDSKVYGISLKDRGAILPAGHTADAAYWFDAEQGGFCTSEYYGEINQKFLDEFNSGIKVGYLEQNWALSREALVYQGLEDDREWERPFIEGAKVTFPYDLEALYSKKGVDLIKSTPFGNQMMADLTMKLIEEEGLGSDDQMDFLSISFSATDYIGHQFGVYSREVMDTYLRLDKDLAKLLSFFDEKFGDDYLLFLTSDHGAAENRNYLAKNAIPSGFLDRRAIADQLDQYLDERLGDKNWILSSGNLNIYLDHELFKDEEIEREDVLKLAYHFLMEQAGVAGVYVPEMPIGDEYLLKMSASGYQAEESGDLVIIEEVNWNAYPSTGSGHGSAYEFDTHVPLLIYGKGVSGRIEGERYQITDLIPSLAIHLGISAPDGVKQFKKIIIE